MILTIWRHGDAESGPVDRQRELTGAGRDDIGFGCHQFHQACSNRVLPQPEQIYYSPWLRTIQTAEIIAAAYTHVPCEEAEFIQPGATTQEVDSALATRFPAPAEDLHVLLVSHQPLVSHLVNFYLADEGSVPPLSPGGLVTFSLDVIAPACGRLLFWSLPPEYEVGT